MKKQSQLRKHLKGFATKEKRAYLKFKCQILVSLEIVATTSTHSPINKSCNVMLKLLRIAICICCFGNKILKLLFQCAGQILEMKDIGRTFQSLGWYFMTVLVGIFIHGGIVLPILYSE